MSQSTSPVRAMANAATVNAAVRRLAGAHRTTMSVGLGRVGVAIGQELLVLKLAESQPCTQAELAVAAGCEPSTITMAVRKLEGVGLVRRTPSPSDARALLVELTPAGEALIPRLEAVQAGVADRIISALPAEVGPAQFVAMMDAVTASLLDRQENGESEHGRQ